MLHIPVLMKEVLAGLNIQPNDTVLDCTINGAGHSSEIVKLLVKDGTLVGLDADANALQVAKGRLSEAISKVELRQTNFRNLSTVLEELKIETVDKVLFDFGLSSNQLADSGRGFSFEKDEPLLMTFQESPTRDDLTAEVFVNDSSEEAIADIIFAYGGERYARRIARAIVEARANTTIKTTSELSAIIVRALPKFYAKGRIHPATKTFQALRMAVNDELGAIKTGLAHAFEKLKPNGRIAAISFHSLEDKIVKDFFRTKKDEGVAELLTKKPIIAGEEEVKANPRSRSAKLRILIKNLK